MRLKHENLVRTILLSAALAVAPAIAAVTAQEHSYSRDQLKIDHPWTRVAPPGGKVAAGFMKITNTGKAADRLIGGSFALSQRVEVHQMSVVDGVMRMGELKDGLEIAPGATVELKPGGYHLMLMELSDAPKLDDRVKGTLMFEKAGEVEVEFAVAPLGATSHSDTKGSSSSADHDHGGGHQAGPHQGGHDTKHHH